VVAQWLVPTGAGRGGSNAWRIDGGRRFRSGVEVSLCVIGRHNSSTFSALGSMAAQDRRQLDSRSWRQNQSHHLCWASALLTATLLAEPSRRIGCARLVMGREEE